MEEALQMEQFEAGRYEKGTGYRYFVPAHINKEWIWKDSQLNSLLEQASIRLGELNAFARLVPNINLFIHLHVTKEAVISSRIEGTQTNIDEALLPKEEIRPERRDDWQEVRNYTDALNAAITELASLPVSSRLLRHTHATLMQGVRGEHKMPGEFRTSQNWIGGSSLTDAVFIPPAHHYLDELMGDLENFLHNKDIHVPALIRIGMAHYQFETIHPFLDGNGRIGRLLITLYLVSEGIMEKPLLYLSSFFERDKGLYYDNLMRVRVKDDLVHWLKYFLTGIEQTARDAAQTLRQVLTLKSRMESLIKEKLDRKAFSGLQLLEHLFKEPFITVKEAEQLTGISKKSANELMRLFSEIGILTEISGQRRYRVFLFKEYLDLFR